MVASTTAQPEKLDLPEISEQITGQTRTELEALREELSTELAGDVTRLVTFCRHQKVSFERWKDSPLSPKQIKEIRNTLGKVIPSGNTLAETLENGDAKSKEVAKSFLNKIVDLMTEQAEQMKSFKEQKEDLNKDVVGEVLGDAATRFKKTFAKNPWTTAIAAGIAAFGIYWLSQQDGIGKYVKGGGFLAVIGWAGNYLSGALSPDGKTAATRLLDLSHTKEGVGDEVSDFLDRFSGDPRVDVEVMRNASALGNIPFNVFLDAYERATEKGKDTIDMAALRRRAGSLGIESDAFESKNGKGLFALLEGIVEKAKTDDGKEGVAALKDKYEGKPGGAFSFWEVVMCEHLDDPEGIAPADDEDDAEEDGSDEGSDSDQNSGASKKSKKKKKSGGGSEVAAKSSASERQLLTIPAFVGTGLSLGKVENTDENGRKFGKAKVKGVELDYEAYTDDDGNTEYVFKDSDGHKAVFRFGEGFSEANRRTEAEKMTSHMRALVKKAIVATPLLAGVDDNKVDWRNEKWVLPYPFTSSYPFLQSFSGRSIDLEVKLKQDGKQVSVYYDGTELSGALSSLQKNFEREVTARWVTQALPALQDFDVRDIQVQSVTVPADVTKPTALQVAVAGSRITLEWDPGTKTTRVTRFEIGSGFVDRKVELAKQNGRLKEVFDEMKEQGEFLGVWWRGTLDVLNLQKPDNQNAEWETFVDFKYNEVFRLYRARLEAIDPTDPEAFKKMQQAYDETVKEALETFESYPGRLSRAKLSEDSAEYGRLQEGLLKFGWSPSYQGAYERFMAMVGPGNINMPGYNEKSNENQYEVVGYLLGQWSRLTAPLANVDFPQQQGNIYYDYSEYVLGEMSKIVSSALDQTTDEGLGSHYWEALIRRGVGLHELKQLEGRFSAIRKMDEWKGSRSADVEQFMHQQRPELKGQARDWKMEPVPGDPSKFKIRWYPGTAAEFEAIMDVNPSTRVLEYTSVQLSEQWIAQHVEAVKASPEFNKQFDDLAKQFEGVPMKAGGFFPDVWEYFDHIEEGSWRAMVAYKREEIIQNYTLELKGILSQGLPPAQAAIAFNNLYKTFSDRYLKDVYQMNKRLAEKIRDAQGDSTKEITEEEFTQFSRGLEFLGYTDAYIGMMRSARAYYERFPYLGSWTHPTAGVNAVMKLVHEKTWFLNKPTLTPQERAYFHAVAEEANQVVRRAYENNNGTGTAVRAGIGPDEIPQTLDIEPMGIWLAAHPNAGQPVVDPMDPNKADAEATPNPNENEKTWLALQDIYKEHWYAKIYEKDQKDVVREGIDNENVAVLKPEIDAQHKAVYMEITWHPEKRDDLIQQYTEYLDQCYETAEAGWWEFWE